MARIARHPGRATQEDRAMNRRIALAAGISLAGAAGRVAAQPLRPRVVFLNPGEPVERGKGPQWRMAARFMASAAAGFGMELEVLYAERDHLLMMQQAEEVAGRTRPPDYVVMVNEKQSAPRMMQALARTPAKVLLIHNDLTAEQRQEFGHERGRMRQWIGTVTTNEVQAHARLAAELCRQLGDRVPQVVGITGDRGTPVSLERAQGFSDYITRVRGGQVLQLAFSDWSQADAEDKARVLLARYPQTHIIWAANDSMALGALRAVKALGAPVLVGGTGAWPDALASLAEGGLAATLGSHFFIGAWAMVLLNDYHQGHDFAAAGGPARKLDYMVVVNRDNAARYDRVVYQRAEAFDFRAYSRARGPGRKPYDFDLASLLHRS
jgi:ABC-type sugar transport system substrate-binding protein